MLVTILGSCVAACIRDPRDRHRRDESLHAAAGRSSGWGDDPQSTRYGNFAMEKLINELIKAGCSRDRMEIKVFGGGNVIDTQQRRSAPEMPNSCCSYLEAEGLRVRRAGSRRAVSAPHSIHPATGRVVRRLLGGPASPRHRARRSRVRGRLKATEAGRR